MKLLLPVDVCGPAYITLGLAEVERMCMIAASRVDETTFRVFNCFFPPQECSGAYVETDDSRGGEDAIGRWQYEMRQVDPDRLIGWWHTHPGSLTPTPSGTDHDTTRKWGLGSIMLITNHPSNKTNGYMLDEGVRSKGSFTIPLTLEWEYDKSPFVPRKFGVSVGGSVRTMGNVVPYDQDEPRKNRPERYDYKTKKFVPDPDWVWSQELKLYVKKGSIESTEGSTGGVSKSPGKCESCFTADTVDSIASYYPYVDMWLCKDCHSFWEDRDGWSEGGGPI